MSALFGIRVEKGETRRMTSREWKQIRYISYKKYVSLLIYFCNFLTQDPGAHLLAETFIPRINWVLIKVEMGNKDGISREIIGDSEPDTGDRKTSRACLRDHLRPPEGLR
ncbi:hypothetical protein HZ326_19502 [Fusarium oxysporum f. sp. albedinis]|nr:hypothetical protein HZ326_19502 [Fusarium oxysporum f. sp. albedinis]